MLKRHQVLLEDWQVEYLKTVAELHDVSISEALRVIFSMGTLCTVSAIHPEYKSGLNIKEAGRAIRTADHPNSPQDRTHKCISAIYFEARKAAEYRLNKISRRGKK